MHNKIITLNIMAVIHHNCIRAPQVNVKIDAWHFSGVLPSVGGGVQGLCQVVLEVHLVQIRQI